MQVGSWERREREREKKNKEWHERAGRCDKKGECGAWRKMPGEKKARLTNGRRDTKLGEEREVEGSRHRDERKEGRQKIR